MSMNIPGSDASVADADMPDATNEDKELALGRFFSIVACILSYIECTSQ